MSELKVRNLMTTQVVTLKPDETVKKAVLKFALNNISGAPVVDGRNHLLGILSENDILHLIMEYQEELDKGGSGSEMLSHTMDSSGEMDETLQAVSDEISSMSVSDVMTVDVLTTVPDASVIDTLKLMLERDVNRLPVVENDPSVGQDVLVGILSRGDIIFSLYKRKIRGLGCWRCTSSPAGATATASSPSGAARP